MTYSLTQDLQDRLNACLEMANRIDGAPSDWYELMAEAVAKLREVEERLERMWQDHRWCGS